MGGSRRVSYSVKFLRVGAYAKLEKREQSTLEKLFLKWELAFSLVT